MQIFLESTRLEFREKNLRVELEDFKELVHWIGVGEGKKEAYLDDGDADDEEGGRPLWDDPTVPNNVEVIHYSFMPKERSVFSTSISELDNFGIHY